MKEIKFSYPKGKEVKTIFISISSRSQARNALRTDVLKTLRSREDIRIVVFVPSAKVNHYRTEFSTSGNLIFEGVNISIKLISGADVFFQRLSLYYVDSPTRRFLLKKWLLLERKVPLRYLVSRLVQFIFGSSKMVRSGIRFLDLHLVRDNRLAGFFDTYKPDVIFTPNIALPLDRALLREAKKRDIRTIGMINAWDNITLSKYPFRILPDKLICHNEIIADEAVHYLGMKRKNLYVSGMPHFDFYVTEPRSSREAFCVRLGIDPRRRIILYTSVGSSSNPTEWQVISQLRDALEEEKLPPDITIVFRQHPTERTDMRAIPKHKHIIVDDSKTIVDRDNEQFSEILENDMKHLADSLYHAAVIVTSTSTISVDASALNRPIINITFDGWETLPFHQSVRRKFTRHHTHYQPIVKSGGVRIAYTIDELIRYINMYLEDPTIDREGRMRIVREQCYKLDGKSGERIAKYILAAL